MVAAIRVWTNPIARLAASGNGGSTSITATSGSATSGSTSVSTSIPATSGSATSSGSTSVSTTSGSTSVSREDIDECSDRIHGRICVNLAARRTVGVCAFVAHSSAAVQVRRGTTQLHATVIHCTLDVLSVHVGTRIPGPYEFPDDDLADAPRACADVGELAAGLDAAFLIDAADVICHLSRLLCNAFKHLPRGNARRKVGNGSL